MESQKENIRFNNLGGTMRLGVYKGIIAKGSKAHTAYQASHLYERHRHRYEINNTHLPELKQTGLKPTVFSETGLVEVLELEKHPFYVGVQYHPELTARPLAPNPIFTAFMHSVKK